MEVRFSVGWDGRAEAASWRVAASHILGSHVDMFTAALCIVCVCVFFGESKAARAPGSYLESRRFALNENGYVSAQECRGCVSANSSCFAGRSWLASWH